MATSGPRSPPNPTPHDRAQRGLDLRDDIHLAWEITRIVLLLGGFALYVAYCAHLFEIATS